MGDRARPPRRSAGRSGLALAGLLALICLAAPRLAQAQSTPEDGVYGLLAVGLPIADGVVFVGGVTSALSGTIALREGRASPGWRVANLTFGGLNAASTVGYAVAMGAVRGIWPYLLWPCLAHAGLGVANLVIGYKLTRLAQATAASAAKTSQLQLSPILAIGGRTEAVVGLSATLALP